MNNKGAKTNPWDRRPWPNSGDESADILFASVGEAITQWERHEAALASLFATFVSAFPSNAARRAYIAVRTFEGRAEMLRAASSSYFEAFENEDHIARFKGILRNSVEFSKRRNDIVHAVVDDFLTKDLMDDGEVVFELSSGYGLYPAFASFKDRASNGAPSYCMTSNDLTYFRDKFLELMQTAVRLQQEIGDNWNAEVALRYKLIEPDP